MFKQRATDPTQRAAQAPDMTAERASGRQHASDGRMRAAAPDWESGAGEIAELAAERRRWAAGADIAA